MNTYQNLLYCRQFVLCRKQIVELSGWNSFILCDFTLYVHPLLTVTTMKKKEKELFLLGSLFDYSNKTATNEEILDRLIRTDTFEELLQVCESYTGRYIIIFRQFLSLKIFHDPSASRKIYYYMRDNEFCCATQPHLIAKHFNIAKTNDPQVLQFYNSFQFNFHNKAGILNGTMYEHINLLLPNWYIDVNKKAVIRFWPYRELKVISLNEGVERVTPILKGFIQSIHHRNKLCMALTSGNDSRLMLAASRDICPDIFYYIFFLPRMRDENHPDIRIHKKILNKINLPAHVIEYNTCVDEDFKDIYFRNYECADESNLPIIYNFFHKQCCGMLNLSSTMSDVTRNVFSANAKIITPQLLSRLWYYNDMSYVVDRYQRWLTGISPLAKKFNYNVLDLFSWEERITAFEQPDNDIARDEVSPFVSRKLLEIMFSVPKRYRDFHTNIFHRLLIKSMWPELAEFPYNPVFNKRVSYALKKMKVYWIIRSALRRC